jgi:hypothetical protein
MNAPDLNACPVLNDRVYLQQYYIELTVDVIKVAYVLRLLRLYDR